MTFRVIIPARYGSTRLPGKPLRLIAGRPLIEHVYARARASGASEVIVATDDVRIASACEQFGADVALTDTTHASGTNRIAEVVRRRGFREHDLIVNVQGDEPLLDPQLIRTVAQHLEDHAAAAIATACHPVEDNTAWVSPNVVKVVFDRHGYALYFSRAPIPHMRAGAPADALWGSDAAPVFRHVGIYAYRVGFLLLYSRLTPAPAEKAEALEQLRALWHGYRISVALVPAPVAGGVDTPEDLERVRRLIDRKPV